MTFKELLRQKDLAHLGQVQGKMHDAQARRVRTSDAFHREHQQVRAVLDDVELALRHKRPLRPNEKIVYTGDMRMFPFPCNTEVREL